MTLEQLCSASVLEVEWSHRAQRILDDNNITTLGQLAAFTDRELRRLRGCGKKTINEYRYELDKRGLTLGEPRFDSQVEAARRRVASMDDLDGHKDRELSTILEALETGLRKQHTGADYDAYVMLQDLVKSHDH